MIFKIGELIFRFSGKRNLLIHFFNNLRVFTNTRWSIEINLQSSYRSLAVEQGTLALVPYIFRSSCFLLYVFFNLSQHLFPIKCFTYIREFINEYLFNFFSDFPMLLLRIFSRPQIDIMNPAS